MEEGYHVITCECKDAVITVPLPAESKPLSCSLQTKGGATGLLASFYDPEAHTWVVKHAPVDVGFVTVTVKVLVLMDPSDSYEVYIAATSAESGAGVDELFELRRRSFAYRTARERRTVEGDAVARARPWPPRGAERPKHPRDLVCLCAPLPVLGGYVLCGGGFLSDYPIHRTGPAMPIATDRFYDRVMGEDAAFFAAVAAERSGDVSALEDPFLVYNMLKPDEDKSRGGDGSGEPLSEESLEYSSWSVTAAPNAGLACFSIGLRSRDVRTTSRVTRGLWWADDSATTVDGSTPSASAALHAADPAQPRDPRRRAVAASADDVVSTPHRSSRRGLDGLLSPGARANLMSPSRFSSPDSEDRSSPDSTVAEPVENGARDNRQRGASREEAGDAEDGRAALRAVRPRTGQSPSFVPSTRAPAARSEGGAEHRVAHPHPHRELFAVDDITRELQTRKDLLRIVALRKLVAITHKPRSHVMDLELPPPHRKIRVRFGLCKETRAAADLFYR